MTDVITHEFDLDAVPGARVAPEDIVQPKRYVPVHVARERLEAAGKWDAVVALVAQDMPTLVKLLSLGEGLDPNDGQVRAILRAVGADPLTILAL